MRRPGNQPAGLVVETLTDSMGNSFFIMVDPPNLPVLDFNALDVDITEAANFASLQVFADAGVMIWAGETNLAPYAIPTATVINTATREVALSANAGDLDGSVVSYAWTWNGGISDSATTTIVLPYGTTAFSLMVTDNDGATATAGTSVEVLPLAAVDTSGDGLNDLMKSTLRDLGFDWNDPQPELTALLAAAGLVSRMDLAAEAYYDLAGMRVLQTPAPIIARDAASGKAMLTLGIQQSGDLGSFTLLPATAPQLSITAIGEIEFEFDAPADAGFYRIEAK